MDPSRAHIKRHDPVWGVGWVLVASGGSRRAAERGKTLFVVQFEHGVSAPVSRGLT
jgi:hypothetical protein